MAVQLPIIGMPSGSADQVPHGDSSEVGSSWREVFPLSAATWDDMQGDRGVGSGVSALVREVYRGTPFLSDFYTYDQDDKLYFKIQMSHRWTRDTEVRGHIHVRPMGSGSGDLRFTGYYCWSKVGEPLPDIGGWTAIDATKAIVAGDQYEEMIVPLFTDTPSGTKESSHLYIYVVRPGASDATDTYHATKDHGTAKANLEFVSLDLHYQSWKRGTPEAIPT